MSQITGNLSYLRPRASSTTSTELAQSYQVDSPQANRLMVIWNSNLDPNAIAQVDTLTVTAGTVGNSYSVGVTVDSDLELYEIAQETGDTATEIAVRLAALINTHPGVSASADTGVITVTGAVPGQAVTLDVSGSTTPGNLVIANVGAAAGTAIVGRIATFQLDFTYVSGGIPKLTVSPAFYDGMAGNPVALTSQPGSATIQGSKSLDAIQTANGVSRPS